MGPTTVLTKGVQVTRGKRGSNRKGTPDIISNGSRIEVGPNQMMILVDSGRIVDYCAEEGCYEVYLSSAPSMFNGELKASVRESFERFKFGGQPGRSQQVYFINLQEIRGIKFGTRNALQYFDNFYNAELFVRCHGSYSVKITDPIKFFMEVAARNATHVDFDDLGDQFNAEFLTALQTAIGQMAVDGVRISSLPSKSMELSKYMATVLDEDWTQARGMDICSVGIASISYDEESKALINMRIQGSTSQVVTSHHAQLNQIKHDYVLLPVWFMNYHYNGKDYNFAMNGQTGTQAGTPPLSWVKALLFSGVLAAVVTGLAILLGGYLFR